MLAMAVPRELPPLDPAIGENPGAPVPFPYTPSRVAKMLPLLAVLYEEDTRSPAYQDLIAELQPRGRRYDLPKMRGERGGFEANAAVRADLLRGFEALADTDLFANGRFTRMVLFRSYVVGDSARHIATILGCDRETVTAHLASGAQRIALVLGWNPQRHGA